jgi:RTX calcium-binding nonapeptide repeat (4 copies)
MRRIVIMGALVALLVGVFASVAYARTFTCTDLPCFGTNNPDTINERPAYGVPDEIHGLRGGDVIYANISPGDVDVVYGNRGRDTLYTNDGDDLDTVYGGAGVDTCYVDPGDEYHGCEVVHISI